VDADIENQDYQAPPPSYPFICGSAAAEKGCRNNLMDAFVDMRESATEFGMVMSGLEGMWSWIEHS
jgi:hypothetical protein